MTSTTLLARTLSLGCALSVLWGCTEAADRDAHSSLLPRKLHIGSFYSEGRCSTLLDLSYQGAFVFDLKADTIQSIQEQGLNFFKGLHSTNVVGGLVADEVGCRERFRT